MNFSFGETTSNGDGDWRRIHEICEKARLLSPAEQKAFVGRECRDDPDAMSQVYAQLEAERLYGSIREKNVLRVDDEPPKPDAPGLKQPPLRRWNWAGLLKIAAGVAV